MTTYEADDGALVIFYLCMRPEHHRHRAAHPELCEYRGCAAYCPADAGEGHQWMPCVTDLRRVVAAGIGAAPAPEHDHGDVARERASALFR